MGRAVKVALTFDLDGYSTWISSHKAKSPSMLSRGEFDPIGARRILRLLADNGIQSTFFVPGHTALAFPPVVKAIAGDGHEIGHHGWVHENPVELPEDEERAILRKGRQVLEDVVGVVPMGYRSPAWDNSPSTVKLLLELGFQYESSMMGNDYEPYWCRLGDSWSTTEEFCFGVPVDLVELPVAWHLDDFPYFEFLATERGYLPGATPTSAVLEIWKAEFDYLYQRVGQGIMTITMHPQIIGRGYRMLMLEEFIKYVASHDNAEFTTCGEYISNWKVGRTPSLPADAGANRKGSL